MSQVVTINIELKDKQAVIAACKRLSWKYEEGEAKFYDGSIARGIVVYVPGWRYPAVVTENGSIKADTYNDQWGKLSDLDQLKQRYGAEQTKSVFATQGLYAGEQQNQDGSLTLTVQLY